MEDFVTYFFQNSLSILLFGYLPTLPPPIVEAQSGHVEILPLSWQLPPTLNSVARKGSGLKASLQIWTTDSKRKLFEHSLSFSSATQRNISASTWVKAPRFLSWLSKKKNNERNAQEDFQEIFEARCLISTYSDKEAMRDFVLDAWTTNPQTFDISFPEGCRWKFKIKSTCNAHWYSTFCNVFCKEQDPYYECSDSGEKICKPGWKGMNCSTDIDECANDQVSPCQNNSTCTNQSGNYSCSCTPGYKGRNCNVDVDECKDLSQCANGGTCRNLVGTFECHCPPHATGPNCEVLRSRRKRSQPGCTAGFCFNGGECHTPNGMCTCPSGYSGLRCETDECARVLPCFHGSCANINSSFVCHCLEAYKGEHCQTRKSCDEVVCENGGACFDSEKGFKCNCSEPFSGDVCEIKDAGFNSSLLFDNSMMNISSASLTQKILRDGSNSKWLPDYLMIFALALAMVLTGALMTVPAVWFFAKRKAEQEKIKKFTIKLKPEAATSEK